MRTTALLAIAVLLMVTSSCKTTQTPAPEVAPDREGEEAARQGGDTPQAAVTATGSAPVADIGREVVLSCTMSNMDRVLQRGLSYVRPHLPPAFAAMLRPSMLKAQLFKSMQMPQLETAVDTTRPVALALVDPERFRGGGRMGSTILAIPVNDAEGVSDALGQVADQHERTPWGDHRFTFGGEKLHLRFADGYALMAGHEQLINGAPGVLMPLIGQQKASQRAARLRVDMAAINRLYGEKIERGLTRMKRKMGRKGPQMAGAAKMMTRWIGYLQSIDDLVLEVDLDRAKIRTLGTLTAAASGGFSTYLKQLRSGPAWGAKYLPRESGLVYLAHQSPDAMLQSIDEGVEVMQGMVQGVISKQAMTRLRDHARLSVKHLSGESAGAVWIDADGSVGAASIARARDAAAAQAAMTRLLQLFSTEIKRLFAAGLPPAVKRELKGARVDLRLRPQGLRVGGVRGTLAQLDIRWPRLKNRQDRREMQQVRRRVHRVFGRRFTIAVASVGDVLVMTAGKSHRKQMQRMIAIARGGKGAGMEQVVSGIVGRRRIVAMLYVPMATMAEQVMRLVEQLTTVPAQVKDMFQKVLPAPGTAVPVSAVVQASGPKLVVEMEISPELVGMITRGVITSLSARAGMPMPPPGP